jgi:hypothetical protein
MGKYEISTWTKSSWPEEWSAGTDFEVIKAYLRLWIVFENINCGP